MHLAGLDEKPAYGHSAVYKGSCNGEKGACMTQLSAKLTVCPTTMSLASAKLALLKLAAQLSSDHENVQAKPVLCDKGGGLGTCDQKEIQTGGGPGSGPHKENAGERLDREISQGVQRATPKKKQFFRFDKSSGTIVKN